jgi:hypothetical protein
MTENNEIQQFHDVDFAPAVQQVTTPTTGSLQRLEAEALAMDKAYKIARALANTEMVPEHFQQGKHGEAAAWNLAAAIMYGAELGMTAVQSAQNIFIIKGKPAVYARTMAAQVRRAGYKIEEVEAGDDRVVWRGERDGKWATSEWTMARAKQANYTSNQKYTTNPTEMLRAKCIAEICRIQYQDVLLGMAYSIEELQLDNVTVQRVVKRESRGATALREIVAAAAESEEPVARVEVSEPVVASGQIALTDDAGNEQLDTIRKLYKAKNMTGQAVLEDIAEFLQFEHKLASLHRLTRDDADAVLAYLQAPPA